MENENEIERNNPFPKCPECGYETYVEGGEEDYYNVWCTNSEDCDWFAEVDIEPEVEQASNCAHEAGEHYMDSCRICGEDFI